MKKKVFIMAVCVLSLPAIAAEKTTKQLTFNPSDGKLLVITMPKGEVVRYTAYERLYYVANVGMLLF